MLEFLAFQTHISFHTNKSTVGDWWLQIIKQKTAIVVIIIAFPARAWGRRLVQLMLL